MRAISSAVASMPSRVIPGPLGSAAVMTPVPASWRRPGPLRLPSRMKGLATVHLAVQLRRPVLLEGETGTGRTEVAKVLRAGRG